MILITHNGFAHCDEITAYAILSEIFPDATLVRTRDMEIIDSDQAKIVFDVGMKYDGDVFFDHHQNDKQMRDNGIPYSSLGLIWRKFGSQFISLFVDGDVDRIFEEIDEKFIQDVDIGDNGVQTDHTKFLTHRHSFSRLISGGVSTIVEFEETAVVLKRILINMITTIDKRITSEKHLDHIIETEYDGDGVIVSDEPIDSLPTTIKEGVCFVVCPENQAASAWRIKTIRVNAWSFENRKPLWKGAGGLTGEELENATGIPGMIFCHSALFLASAKTKEAAIEFAKMSMKE